MSARISGSVQECLMIAFVAGLLGGCKASIELPSEPRTEDSTQSAPSLVDDSATLLSLAPGLAIPQGSRVGLIGADTSWIGPLERTVAKGGSVTRWDVSGSFAHSMPASHFAEFDDLLLIECWADLSRKIDASPDLFLRELAARLVPGGRIWVVERRVSKESGSPERGAAWPDIVAMSRLAGLSVRVVDVNRLPDHVIVQVEKRLNPLP